MTHKIDKATYEGYMWESDKTAPEIYHGKEEIDFSLTDGENPFIVEGQLYDRENNISISIRFVDGKYIITRFDGKHGIFINRNGCKDNGIPQIKYETGEEELYIPNSAMQLDGKVLKFIRLWKEDTDDDSCGFQTLYPSGLVFKGFCSK